MYRLKATLFYRNRLNPEDQQIYDSLVEQWMHIRPEVVVKRSNKKMTELLVAVMRDYPLLFYVDYHAPFTASHGVTQTRMGGNYLYSLEEARRLLDECYNWGVNLVRQIPPNTDDVGKALWLHDWLVKNVTYGKKDPERAYNILGVIRDGEAVCEGIAKCYKLLCDLAEIPCIYVSGLLDGGRHGWNMIWLGGKATFVDVTSDICMKTDPARYHFARKDEEMPCYEWDRNVIPAAVLRNLNYPICTAAVPGDLPGLVRKLEPGKNLGIHLAYLGQNDQAGLESACKRIMQLLRWKKRELRCSLTTRTVYVEGA